jgi:hypothetical protein
VLDGGAGGLGLDRANWAAGVQVVFPNLFDFSVLRSRRAAAGALTRAESARYDEAILTCESTASGRRHAGCGSSRCQNTLVQLTAARQSEAQARARYDAGLTGITEVAEAQNLLAGAEYQDATAHVDIWRAPGSRRCAWRLVSFVGLLRIRRVIAIWLIRGALRRPITVVVAIIMSRSAGFGVSRMRADLSDLDLPVIYVAQPYGGMSAQMEGFITYY